VSTEQQKENKTIKIQENSINRFIEAYSDQYEIVGEYKDDGVSAFINRPDYEEMLIQLFKNKADGIIIKALSRVGRSMKQLVNLVDKLEKNDKHFIVLDHNINTTSKEGRLFFHILAAIAQYEAELIVERMKEGIQRYLENGGVLGRKLIITDEKIIRKIKKLYIKNRMGTTAISIFLKGEDPSTKVSSGTIRNILIKEGVKLRGIYER
jgi:DNA invertase Pin-like site-specific DNA recombinase